MTDILLRKPASGAIINGVPMRAVGGDRPPCYLAHPVTCFGILLQRDAIRTLTVRGWRVLNPDGRQHDKGYREKGMAHFTVLVGLCDRLAFIRMPSCAVGVGVAKEPVVGQSAARRFKTSARRI